VLLSLGVSHTNELEQGEALGFLRQWVLRHPKHAAAAGQVPAPGDSSQAASYVVSGGAAWMLLQWVGGRRFRRLRKGCAEHWVDG
jgi:NADPH:quinone reductase-like Zn-dependent oxidoreductase